jgi:signal transduction histidine kinase
MGTLVGAVAHEVRNPLFALSATLDAFEARFTERQEFGQYFGPLRNQVDRVSALMQDLLEYGKPHTPSFETQPLAPVIEQAVESCRDLAQRRRVEVHVLVPEELPPFPLDRLRLVQVYDNLLENALQHSAEGATVEVRARQTTAANVPSVECVVRDSGPGFAPKEMASVFEPFYTQRQGGTGLGLAIAWRIVHEHGGTIVAGNAPDGGATVTVTLPLQPAVQGAVSPPAPESSA